MATKKTKKIVQKNLSKEVEKRIDKAIDKTIDIIVDKRLDEIDKSIKVKPEEKPNKDYKLIFATSYFLFFISLFFAKEHQDKKFYANQGLMVLIEAAISALIWVLIDTLFGFTAGLIVGCVLFGFIVLLALTGCIKTLMGKDKYVLPLIGRITLIK